MPQTSEIFETLEYGPAPESAERARAWLDERGRSFGLFIGGDWVEGAGAEAFDTVNPANGTALARITQGGSEDVDRAVRAARAAQEPWARLGGHARARFLYALARRIHRHARLFSVLETLDNGKPVRESRDIDIPLVVRHFYHHAGWAQLMDAEFPDQVPVGVAGQIIPWNFPLLMLAWKIAPALATGNTVVLKPAEFTSLTALLFAEICRETELPSGVVNVVTGDGRTGKELVAHPDVDKIAFTGSTEVGRLIRSRTAGSGKRLSLELGGKSPFIVYEDADLDGVVEGVVDAIWFNQGQVCCAGSRILVQEGVAEALERKLKARMEMLRMGDPLDKAVDMGAIIAPVQLEKIRRLVDEGRRDGAHVWQPSWSTPAEGYFYPPTLCTRVAPASAIAQVEIFGPVVVMMTFRTPEESVRLANDTRYGLAASIWSENINLALDVAPKVKTGTVWINCTNVFDAASGFGGYRESGFGREGGREGLHEYLQPAWQARDGASTRENVGAVPQIVADESVSSEDGLPGPLREDNRSPLAGDAMPRVDRTTRMYIGGRQARPDGGYTMLVRGASGEVVGEVGRGNRKDIRNAVEAARRAGGWADRTAHNRAQILYFIAENLAVRASEFAARIRSLTGESHGRASEEVDLSIRRLFSYAAHADKWDGDVHRTPYRNVTLAMPESLGVVGIVCPERNPLLGFVSLIAPAIATGNTVVGVPSERWPLSATDLCQVLDTSDLPGGVVNVVTGEHAELTPVLAAHDDVDAIWYFGADFGVEEVERLSTGNMKQTWTEAGLIRRWRTREQGEGDEFLRRATQVKNIWIPYGE
ncbi:MAG: aldehyde dehydrogenase family protein [Gammaproteobacteria bacterium]|nr:aldehyde dehydrogenase family protein [Gammaproteobacteria bacterium]MXW10398.1 aldehyde dehydrogenase family protein [Gammaproteobacteria bacterium]MYC51102.1 aldehyde dehydrogenase family protein [Gammaproteobacteria bacterium]